MIFRPYCQQSAQTHNRSQVRYFMEFKNCWWMQWLLPFFSETHTHTIYQQSGGVSNKSVFPKQMCSNSDTLSDDYTWLPLLVPRVPDHRLTNPTNITQSIEHYVIWHHSEKFDQIIETLADDDWCWIWRVYHCREWSGRRCCCVFFRFGR